MYIKEGEGIPGRETRMDEGMGWNDRSQRTVRRQLEALGTKNGGGRVGGHQL